MGEIIQFPISEDDFFKRFQSDGMPPELVVCLKAAYKNAIERLRSAPAVEVRVNSEYVEQMKEFTQQYRDYLKLMFEILLTKEAENCLLKFQLSKSGGAT